jgi:hypothetical protein
MPVTFVNPQTGQQKIVRSGFSWVLFLLVEFFGIPLFIRGLHLHGAIVAVIGMVAAFSPGFSSLVPLAGFALIGAMVYYGIKGNELTMQHLERNGWVRSVPGVAPAPASLAALAEGPDVPSVDGEKTCPRCAESVKAAAVVCRHCGHTFNGNGIGTGTIPSHAPAPTTNKFLKGAGIAAAVLVGLAVIGAIVSPETQNAASPSGGSADAQPPSAAAISVGAAELYRAYEANEQAAQLQYGGQPLLISGTIASIELDSLDEPMVSLQADDMFAEVTLHFSSDAANQTAALRQGDWLTAQCNEVTEFLGAPQLDDCSIVPAGAETAQAPGDRIQASSFSSSSSSTSNCAGRYAYVPRDFNSEVGFSVEVQPTAIAVQWTDYGNAFAEKRVQSDGSIVFHMDNDGPSELHCNGSQATVQFAETQDSPPRTFQLRRTDKDIFAIAEENGWIAGE